MSKIKINLAKSAGFCFGVKRALEIAFKTAHSGKEVCMLGDIVHNEDVVKEIEQAGIRKIAKLAKGKNKSLLIRAHGTSIDILIKAERLGYDIVDATCPMVKEIHRIAKDMEKKGYRIIVIGDKKHDEVYGIVGQLKYKAIIIDKIENIPQGVREIKKACVIVQSTQNMKKALAIVDNLRLIVKDLEFFNTICRPTRMKQEEIKKMPLENDAMVIIGSKTSANTKRLYEISKAINKRSYWISSRKEIKLGWFKSIKSIGITAGASTPDSTTQEVINHLLLITQ